ncbi:class I SAM-dependent methyltransferase [bacterium]|nr:class I SAM-dependent methyltransferase [bacterium]
MSKKKNKKSAKLEPFDKYDLYMQSVQAPEADVEFFAKTYKEIRKKSARVLREDFCGTFGITCEWVKDNSRNFGIGIDLDPEPLKYGMENHYSQLSTEQKKRIHIVEDNVMSAKVDKADIVAAVNFSYYLFKSRLLLRSYFKKAFAGLKEDGIFLVDCFGGPLCMEPNEEEKVFPEFSYFWDQDKYDPVTNEALFYIHFKRKGEKKRKKVFTYDWRMWTIPELQSLMIEAGFRETHVYWEGTDKNGEGNGEFKRVTSGEDCGAWVAYVCGVK